MHEQLKNTRLEHQRLKVEIDSIKHSFSLKEQSYKRRVRDLERERDAIREGQDVFQVDENIQGSFDRQSELGEYMSKLDALKENK